VKNWLTKGRYIIGYDDNGEAMWSLSHSESLNMWLVAVAIMSVSVASCCVTKTEAGKRIDILTERGVEQ